MWPRLRRSFVHELTGVLSLVVMCSTAAPAAALSCSTQFSTLPAHGQKAPRNTRIWIQTYPGEPTDDYRLRDAEGTRYSFIVTRIPVATWSVDVLTPDQPLPFPGTYAIERCGDPAWIVCTPVTRFEVIDEIDEQAPELPEIEASRSEATRGDWGSSRLAIITLQGDAFTLADADGEGLDSPLDEGARLASLSLLPELYLGTGVCMPRSFEGNHADVRFGTFDLAGNFSGYTEPQRVDIPELDGCALGAGSNGGWAVLLALALLGRRRRRAES